MTETNQAAAAQAQQADKGRDQNGRFAQGNQGGPGNPFARQVAALRKALLDKVTPEDIQAIAEKLILQAKCGNVQAAKLVLSYTIGKPKPTVEPDNLDAEEWEQLKTTAHKIYEVDKAMGPGLDLPLKMARVSRPGYTSDYTRMIGQYLKDPNRVEEIVATGGYMNPAEDIAVVSPPSANGVNRIKDPSTNGNNRMKTPSTNGVKHPVGAGS
jgi:hypothetical protein